MWIYFNTIVDSQIVYSSQQDGHWYIGSTPIELLGVPHNISIGRKNVFVLFLGQSGMYGEMANNINIYDFEGKFLYNIGDILEGEITLIEKKFDFSSIVAHTKETLIKPPWACLFGSVSLDESHEYLTAYDGGEQWLFDITDKKFIKKVFTH